MDIKKINTTILNEVLKKEKSQQEQAIKKQTTRLITVSMVILHSL